MLVDCESQTADLRPILDRYPDLIAKLPLRELWRMDAWERMKLLISHPVEAVVLLPTLFGDDVWAAYLPVLAPKIIREAVKVCPWATLTTSQKRYMSLSPKH